MCSACGCDSGPPRRLFEVVCAVQNRVTRWFSPPIINPEKGRGTNTCWLGIGAGLLWIGWAGSPPFLYEWCLRTPFLFVWLVIQPNRRTRIAGRWQTTESGLRDVRPPTYTIFHCGGFSVPFSIAKPTLGGTTTPCRCPETHKKSEPLTQPPTQPTAHAATSRSHLTQPRASRSLCWFRRWVAGATS